MNLADKSMLDERRRAVALALVVFATAAAVYLNALGNDFAYDDHWIIETRPVVQDLTRIGEIVTAEYWPSQSSSGLYRPVTLLSFALDWKIWNGDPMGFHLVNVLLHAFVSVLVLILLLEFFPWWAAGAGGMVFAVHSVHTEAVANVVGRAELLMAAFAVIAVIVYVRSMRDDRLTPSRAAIIIVSGALACLSKETGFVLPALLLCTDLPLLARKPDLRSFAAKRSWLFGGLAAVLLGLMLLRAGLLGSAVQSVPSNTFLPDASFSTRLLTMARVWPRYLELSFFPLDLSADYSPAVIMPADHLTLAGALGIALLAVLATLAAVSFRRVPEIGMAFAWFAISILPVSNLVVVAEIVLAERTLYLPSLAVSMIAAVVLARARPRRRRWIAAATAIWVLSFSVVTIQRNAVWRNTESVFEDLRKNHPESTRVMWEFAGQLHRRGHLEGAERWLRRAIEVWPYNPELQMDYARFLIEQGRLAEAEEHVVAARQQRPWAVDVHKLLIELRLRRDDKWGAAQAADSAIVAIRPDAELHALRAGVLASVGRLEGAIRSAEEAVRKDPESWRHWFILARLRHAVGDSAAVRIALDGAERSGAVGPVQADSLRRVWGALSR